MIKYMLAMTKRLRLILFLVLAGLILSLWHEPLLAKEALHEARVHQVHDGDTITLRLDGKKYRTRLIGIDAPEMGQRPWGRRAKDHLIQIMKRTNWKVYVETDEEQQDKYGRLLVYLWTKNHVLINEMMINDGYAASFTIEPNTKYSNRFIKAENRARQKQKGIWGTQGLKESPTEWRKKHPRKD
jgi:micrococcal nuclease